MALNLAGRILHYVLKSPEPTIKRFYKDILGMQVQRHEVFSEGCEATCNGPYNNRWTKTMIGYGPENSHFVIEVTYNYSVPSYELGDDFISITIRSRDVIEKAKSSNWPIKKENGLYVIEAPGGYRFEIIDEPAPKGKNPVEKMTLASSNLAKTIAYWNGILGLKILKQDETTVAFAYQEDECLLEFKDIGRPVKRATASGRLAFAVPGASLPEIQKKIEDTKHKIVTPLISLDTPGKATVTVVILADPDGHEICFVDEEGFNELSVPTGEPSAL